VRALSFTEKAYKQLNDWESADKKIRTKIIKLLNEIIETPFTGTGKPEALKHNLTGCWSRRITKEHRLVYQVTKSSIIVISCKFHY
jgi:toxin YoeB